MTETSLYSTIVETTRALIIVLDTEGRVLLFNQACERVTGYRLEELKGRPFWDFLLLPEEVAGVKAVFENLRAGRFPNQYENYWVTKSGERRFIEWSNSAMANESGQVALIIGTGIDVTAKRDVEARLRESQEQFQELASAVPLVLWIRDLKRDQVLYVSPAFEKIWGRSLPDLGSALEVFRDSIHPADRQAMFQQLKDEAASAEPGDNEYRIIRPDGGVRWIHSRSYAIRDAEGTPCRIVGYTEDITDRKTAEQALLEAQQRQSALLNTVADAAWLKDARGVFLEVNRGFLERFGVELSQVVGKTAFDLFPPEIAECYAAEEGESIRTGQSLRFERSRLLNGEERWYEVIRSPVIDAGGRVVGIAGIERDVTERKLAEAQHIARNAAQRNTLVREVHHRIKNNLQGVVTLIQQLATAHPQSASLLNAAITRLDTIATVHGLYGITGDRELRLEQIILRLVSSLKSLYANLPVQLAVSNSVSARVTENEIVPLALIVNELIMNAIKHSRATADGNPVEIALEGDGDCARIVIRNAAGRFPGHFNFDTGAGLGNGLSLVKSLLPPDGALLRFESTTGPAGAKVELTLSPPVIALSPLST